jgi:3'(2'), 5'-bisphosphate nucleotidase
MIDEIRSIAREAGTEILSIYNGPIAVEYKEDKSPLTEADRRSHQIICHRLAGLTPHIPVVSEEGEAAVQLAASGGRFWLVDPVDGTKEFLKRTGDFTVNIALIENRRPILGVVYAPAKNLMYSAEAGRGAWKQNGNPTPVLIKTRPAKTDRLAVVASKDHAGPQVEALLKLLPQAELLSMGSSLKFCLVAEGKADLYPRFGPTMEWDTAAAQCVVESAGGAVLTLQGQPFQYEKPGFKNEGFVTVGDLSLAWKQWM